MNVKVTAYLEYEGEPEGLEPIAEEVADVLAARGYGVAAAGGDEPVRAMVVVSAVEPCKRVSTMVKRALKGSWLVVIPTEGGDSERK